MKRIELICVWMVLMCVIIVKGNSDEGQLPPPQDAAQREQLLGQQMIQKEEKRRDSVGINYQHLHTYVFKVNPKLAEDFIIQVDEDHVIKCVIAVHWLESDVYIDSQYKEGEEVRIMVYESRKQLIINDVFYRASGISFQARKGNEYLIRFVHQGREKLIHLNMENYVPAGKTSNALSTDHIITHDTKIRAIKNKLITYLGIMEYQATFNQNIAARVLSDTRKYMYYQVVEIFIIIVATITQIYTIRRLLKKTSVV